MFSRNATEKFQLIGRKSTNLMYALLAVKEASTNSLLGFVVCTTSSLPNYSDIGTSGKSLWTSANMSLSLSESNGTSSSGAPAWKYFD